MDPNKCVVRRATLEDLPALRGLWDIARHPTQELEKHLTEFQLVTRPDGILLGSAALRMVGQHGLLHSEAFYQSDQADSLRPLLWERLQILARNHGLVRLWTHERSAFWAQVGFHPARTEDLNRLPAALGDASAPWLCLRLRDESLLSSALEKEFELFQLMERQKSERMLERAKTLKWIAGLIAGGFIVGALGVLYMIFSRRKQPPPTAPD